MTTRIPGIDLSHWNFVTDWQAVAGAVDFVYVKASEGLTYVDSKFRAYFDAAGRVGLQRSAYHFFRANQNGMGQARHFVTTVGADRGELPLAVDVESVDATPAWALTINLRQCLEEVERLTGRRPIIYSRASFWNTYTTRPVWAGEYEWWLAHYSATIDGPALPFGVSRWRVWQWTSTGAVPGVAGNCDRNWLVTVPVTIETQIKQHTAAIRSLL